MNDMEREAFQIVFRFYEKWREQIIETHEQWEDFAKDIEKMAMDLRIDHNPLGWHLMCGVIDTFNDLYKDGRKPVPSGYFGRDDI